MTNPHLETFLNHFKQFVVNSTLVKLSLGNYKGIALELKNVYVKPVVIKREAKLSFTYRYKTRDIVKNFSLEEGQVLVQSLLDSGFNVATVHGLEEELQFEVLPSGKSVLRVKQVSNTETVNLDHNRKKKRLVESNGSSYLSDLGITDEAGVVYQNAQDKFKQINRYVEILAPMLGDLLKQDEITAVDMGSGKGYLTFALYDYLVNTKQKVVKVEGIEYREDLVELCNKIASDSNFSDLKFRQGTIQEFDAKADLLIALHACDTATDDAIYKGIKGDAKLIVVAPCCHKQVRKEMEKGAGDRVLSLITSYGILLERQAEMVTDALRSLYLEYMGYKTKVFQFISDSHTPKNVMIVGAKRSESEQLSTQRKAEIKIQIDQSLKFFGLRYHQLGKLLGL